MKNNWQTKKLGEICNIELGKTPFRGNPKFWDTEKRTNNIWLSIADLLNTEGNIIFDSKEYISDVGAKLCKIVKKGTLLASFKLTLGRLAFTGKDLYTNEAIVALSIKNEKDISKDYLYHFLIHFDWHGEVKGDIKIKGKTLNKAKLKEIVISFPPLPEQHRIEKILDEVFENIAKAKENAEKNLQNSKDLFESYLQNVFEDKGEGWNEMRLCEVCLFKPPKQEARTKIWSEAEVSFLPMEDLGINTKIVTPKKTRKLKEVIGSYTYFADGDVLLAKITPCFENGKLGIARNLANGIGFGSSEYIVIRSGGRLIPEYIYYFLLRRQFRNEGAELMTGAVGHKRVNIDFVHNSFISFPSTGAQKSIVAKLDALSEQTKKLEEIYKQKLADLEELKKSVLKKAFNGEL